MADTPNDPEAKAAAPAAAEAAPRKRPKPGERRVQILQALAGMLEQPGAERVTTSALAARLGVSEAALYRHFASKAQMFEGLIEFIEQSIFTLVNQIAEREAVHAVRLRKLVTLVLQFAEKNPGMTRVIQAAGRLIRSETDRGVIVLICGRFLEEPYVDRLPKDWFNHSPRELVSENPANDIRGFFAGDPANNSRPNSIH